MLSMCGLLYRVESQLLHTCSVGGLVFGWLDELSLQPTLPTTEVRLGAELGKRTYFVWGNSVR